MKMLHPNSIAKNIFHLFYSTAAASLLQALVLIYLASYLEAYHYGIFSVALASAMVMGYFTDSGLTEIAIREGSKKNVDLEAILSSYIKVRVVLLAVTLGGGSCFVCVFYSGNPELARIAYYLSIPMVIGLALQGVGTMFFQLIRKMQYIGFIRMFSSLMLICTLANSVLFSLSPVIVCFMYGLSYCMSGVFAVLLVAKHIRIRLHKPFLHGFLKDFTSFMFSGLLFILTPHLGPIILEKTVTLKEVGLFAVAYRIPQALQQVPMIVAGAYRPVLFNHYHNEQSEEHIEMNIMLIKIMALFGIVISIPLYYLSDEFILLLFGESWASSSSALKVLSLLLLIQAIGIALADGLTTRGRQIYRTVVQLFSVLSGISLYILFSSSYGIVGGAYAGLSVEIIALIGYWICLPNRMRIAKKSIIPYVFYFAVFLIVLTFTMDDHPYAAAIVHLVGMVLLLVLDKQLKEKAAGLIKAGISQFKVGERVERAVYK
jgi:O-antigen/teichoic acid export membrane protein